MITRLFLSVLVSLVVGLGTFRAWQSLHQFTDEQIARIAESESYAARSQLIQNVEKVVDALEGARAWWSSYEDSQAQLAGDEAMKLAVESGATAVLWDDPEQGVRFARTREHPVLDFRPDDTQWRIYQGLLSRAREVTRDTMAGPFLDSEGRPFFEVYLLDERTPERGRLVAVIDAQECLHALLSNESPGYAVQVFWGEVKLYQRDVIAAGIPPSWLREGYIRSTLGSLWRVVHAPTLELVENLKSPAIDMLLLLGLVIAVLMGTLTFENWRAYSRARAAERAERKLAELNRDLEMEVGKRTRELAQRTTDLQMVTDSVAHDMRNPLNTIAMNVELFEAGQRDALDPAAFAPLRRVRPAIRQMTEILDRMLGLSAVTHARFKRQRFDMRELVIEVHKELLAVAPDQPVDLEVAELPAVNANRKLVKMLLINLLGNAIKYTRTRDKPRIRVSSETRDGVDVFCVSDNGIGFDPRLSGRLFAAFERLDPDQSTEGTGLGLALVARVVERHGGRVWADGVPGSKASFFFTLEPARPPDET